MKKYLIALFICFIVSYSFGQTIISSVVASAGETSGTDIKVSWTLGEIAIATLGGGGSYILTQGFQQGSFEITSVGKPLSNNFKLQVYPNPATEHVWVRLESEDIHKAFVELYDMGGKLVYSKKVNDFSDPHMIMLNEFSASQYFLRISDSRGNVLQTFKLIKR